MEKKQVFWIGATAVLVAAISASLVAHVMAKQNEPMAAPSQSPATLVSLPSAPVQPVPSIQPISDKERDAALSHVKSISDGKATVADVFRGPNNYLGVVVAVQDKKFIGWMTPDLEIFIVGALFDKNGKNITQVEMLGRGFASASEAQAAPAQAPTTGSDSKPQQLVSQDAIQKVTQNLTSYIEGKSGPVVTAFIDYNCGYCQQFYQQTRNLVSNGAIRIKWVPVAILTDDSWNKADAVMTNPDPVAAMGLAEQNRLTPSVAVSPAMQKKIWSNTKALELISNGNSGTPTLMIQKKDGTYSTSPGLPHDLNGFLAQAGR